MTSLLCRRAFQRQTALALRAAPSARNLHVTAAVHKRRSQAIDTAFDDAFGDDAFGSEPKAPSTNASSKPAITPITPSKKAKLTLEERTERFSELLNHLSARIGRNPSVKLPPRNSSWVHLIQLAQTPADLHKVVDLFPLWREFGRDFGDSISELFTRRCQELKDPKLALDVFGNYAKYGLKLNLNSARQLVHSLHLEHSLEKTIQATALFGAYGLPEVSEDLPTGSMVAAACFAEAKKGGDSANDALKVGQELLPSLKILVGEKHDVRRIQGEKPRKWTRWALGKVERALMNGQGGKEFHGAKWLREWRAKHGYALN